jgi:hypothetical protein
LSTPIACGIVYKWLTGSIVKEISSSGLVPRARSWSTALKCINPFSSSCSTNQKSPTYATAAEVSTVDSSAAPVVLFATIAESCQVSSKAWVISYQITYHNRGFWLRTSGGVTRFLVDGWIHTDNETRSGDGEREEIRGRWWGPHTFAGKFAAFYAVGNPFLSQFALRYWIAPLSEPFPVPHFFSPY